MTLCNCESCTHVKSIAWLAALARAAGWPITSTLYLMEVVAWAELAAKIERAVRAGELRTAPGAATRRRPS